MTPDHSIPPELEKLAELPAPRSSAALWARIDASRRAGAEPSLAPFEVPSEPLVEEWPGHVRRRVAGRPLIGGVALLTAAALLAWLVVRPTQTLEAGMISGRLQLSPMTPRAGERIDVRYTAGALLGRPSQLVLRARVRTERAESYEAGVPVITVGMLERVNGTEYRGQFVLPDSFVYAALAVEDNVASEVDDFGGRAWEVIRAGPDGRPLLDALEQRAHDLMGRSWEEGLATARRLVALYPDSVRAQKWLHMYELWMGIGTDSTRAVHLRHARQFAARDLGRPMSATELGEQFWYVRTMDSSMAAPWRARLRREAPTSGLAVQEELIEIGQLVAARQLDSAGAAQKLNALWPSVPRERAWQVGGAALSFLDADPAKAEDRRQWVDRLYAADSTESGRRRLAQELIDVQATRVDGIARLRSLLAESAPGTSYRRLGESQRMYARRLTEEHARTMAALGGALLANGSYQAARDTLRLATTLSWSPITWRRLSEANLSLRDSVAAASAWAHMVVDPRTVDSTRDSLGRAAARLLGDQGWSERQTAARRTLGAHLDARAIRRILGDVELVSVDGGRATLTGLARRKKGLAVVFWSPLCGPAVEALPEIESLRRRLEQQGVPLVIIAEQSTVTPELTTVLTTHRVQAPVYLDADGAAAARFNNWGTPTLYLLDAGGRVMFPGTSDVQELLLYSAALHPAAP